jgi:hypothetical protein
VVSSLGTVHGANKNKDQQRQKEAGGKLDDRRDSGSATKGFRAIEATDEVYVIDFASSVSRRVQFRLDVQIDFLSQIDRTHCETE